MYVHFINNNILPQVQKNVEKYKVWWTFKPNSTLKAYLQSINVNLDHYFTPDELIKTVQKILDRDYVIQSNSQIITLDPCHHSIFNTVILFTPHIISYLLPHINIVSSDLSVNLQNQSVEKHLRITPPSDLIYEDNSSRFWVHPTLNSILSKHPPLIHTWKNLLSLFTELCTSNNNHFSHQSDQFIIVNPNSPVATIFTFHCFHVSQCEIILKQLTKYLGRYDSLATTCNNLKKEFVFYDFFNNKESTYKSVIMFIDNLLNMLTPPFSPLMV